METYFENLKSNERKDKSPDSGPEIEMGKWPFVVRRLFSIANLVLASAVGYLVLSIFAGEITRLSVIQRVEQIVTSLGILPAVVPIGLLVIAFVNFKYVQRYRFARHQAIMATQNRIEIQTALADLERRLVSSLSKGVEPLHSDHKLDLPPGQGERRFRTQWELYDAWLDALGVGKNQSNVKR